MKNPLFLLAGAALLYYFFTRQAAAAGADAPAVVDDSGKVTTPQQPSRDTSGDRALPPGVSAHDPEQLRRAGILRGDGSYKRGYEWLASV